MLPEPQIAILIPTRNNAADLIDCIDAVSKIDYPAEKLSVIIWDNNSQAHNKKIAMDFLQHKAQESAIKYRYIENNTNLGVYTSRDELLKSIESDVQYILSIDDDVILPQNLFSELFSNFKNDSAVGIVGPRTIFDDSCDETAHGAGFVNWWLGLYTEVDANRSMECDYVIGCCMLIRKTVVDRIGGFDRDYYTSHGEVDFCVRAKKKGFKVIYDPGVHVRHRVDRRGTRTLNRIYYVYRNKLFVIKKNAPIPQLLFSLALYLLFWMPKSILDSVIINKRLNAREIRTILQAMADGWLNRTGKRF